MEFEIISEIVEQDKFIKYNIKESGYPLSFDEVLGLLENDESFRASLIKVFSAIPFEAYNLEFPSIKIDNINRSFEFVAVNTPALLNNKTDSSAFSTHFEEGELTAIFENLGGDAVLISPCPSKSLDFGHLRSFLKDAPKENINDFFIAIAEITTSNLKNEPIWLNTSGLGVPWLHFRIDDAPKYYQFVPYKE